MPTLEEIKNTLPDYAKDIKLNLASLTSDTTLNDVQKAGTFIACAIACREPNLLAATLNDFAGALSPEQLNAAKAAASIMGMNNIYYRFVHLAANKDYSTLPARLRMNVIANSGASKDEFELWSLAVSAINGCGMCIDSHEKVLRDHGLTTEQIQTAVRIAATLHAVAVTVASEHALRQMGTPSATVAA